MTENYRGIKFNITRKCTYNIVISMLVENDVVYVTAPFTVSDEELKNYLSANAPKIKKARARLNENANEFIDYFYRKNLAVFGEEYFIKFTESGATNSFEASEHNITVNFKAGAALEQKANYIKRKYSEFLQEKSKDVLDKALEALDKDINYFSDWVFTWSIDKWVYYDAEKNILYINPQITTQAPNYLKYAVLDELMKNSFTTDSAYKYTMESYIPGWKKIRQWCSAHTPDDFIRRKTKESIVLINESDIKKIKSEVLFKYPPKAEDYRVELQNIINLSGKGENEKDILASFDYEAIVYTEYKSDSFQWYSVPCNKRGEELCVGHISPYFPKPADSGDDYFPEEFVPPISEDDYAAIANDFLEQYSPLSLEDNTPVPVKEIAETAGLKVKEFSGLEEKLCTSCITVLDDCNITDNQGNIIIADAKQGEIYIDPKASKEENNSRIARAYYHWQFHRAAFSYMNTISNSNKKDNKCIFDPLNTDGATKLELMSAREKISEQAFRMAAMTMVPDSTFDSLLDSVIKEIYEKGCIEALLKLLSKLYMAGRTDIIRRLSDKGFDIYKYVKDEEKTSLLYKNIVDAVNNSAENAEKIQSMNDSFSSTLKKLIAVKRSLKKEPQSLSELSGISDHTLSRMRVKDGMEVSLQMILGVCCGLGLSLPETEMLLDKSPFRLQPTIPEHYAYKSVIPLFKSFTVVEINKILEDAGVRRIGAAKDLDAR